MQGWFNIQKSINVTHHIKQAKQEKSHNKSRETEKAFDKIYHPFMIKTLSKLRIEENVLNLIKNIYKNLQLTT